MKRQRADPVTQWGSSANCVALDKAVTSISAAYHRCRQSPGAHEQPAGAQGDRTVRWMPFIGQLWPLKTLTPGGRD